MPASGEPTPDGKRLLAGTIAAASPAVLVAHWRAFLATAAQGGYIARYRGDTLSLETAADASALALDLHARVVSHETLAKPYLTLTSGRHPTPYLNLTYETGHKTLARSLGRPLARLTSNFFRLPPAEDVISGDARGSATSRPPHQGAYADRDLPKYLILFDCFSNSLPLTRRISSSRKVRS